MKTVDTKHYVTPSNQLAKAQADLATMRALLDDIREHLWSCGPPADGWGRVDRGRDSDQQKLLARINEALEPHDEVNK